MSIFENCTFFVSIDVKNKLQLTKTIKDNGGSINFLVTKQCTHYVTIDREFQNQPTNVKKAVTLGIHVVSEGFVTDCIERSVRLDEAPYKFVAKPQPKLFDITSSPIKRPDLIPTSPTKPKASYVSSSPAPSAASPKARRKIVDSEDYGLDPKEDFVLPAVTAIAPSLSATPAAYAPLHSSTSAIKKTASFATSYSTPVTSLPPAPAPSASYSTQSIKYEFDINKYNFGTASKTTSVSNNTTSIGSSDDKFQLIPHPKNVKYQLYTFGSPQEPKFPDNYKTVKTHTLQFTDITNNNNKYYILELHEGITLEGNIVYRVYTNYGRTSGKATKETRYPKGLDDSLNCYSFIYNEKTSAKKGYKPVSLSASKITSTSDSATPKSDAPSNLPEEIQSLVKTLFTEATTHLTNSCSANITENGIETPLGVLSLEQVEKGEKILDKIHIELKASSPLESRLAQLSSEFYTVIPHKMGRSKEDINRSVIRNLDQLSAKVDLLQLMKDLLKINQSGGLSGGSAVDMKYSSLKSEITHLHTYSSEYESIARLVKDTQGDSKVSITNVFKINRQTEGTSFNNSITPTKLLFHGSRPANFVGILSRGMLMPKVIVNNGGSRTDFGFLGAGIYFADKFSTSCLYAAPVAAETSDNSSRFILVSEVALGMVNKLTKIDSTITKPPTGYHSCLGVANNGINNSDFKDNEYVIYNTNQQKQQYLVQFTLDSSSIPTPAASASAYSSNKSSLSSFAATKSAAPVASAPTKTTYPSFPEKQLPSFVKSAAPMTSTPTPTPSNTSVPIVKKPVTPYTPPPTSSVPAATVPLKSNDLLEFPEETKHREMFAKEFGVNKEKFLGLENVFNEPRYKDPQFDLSSHFIVMPFLRDQVYTNSAPRIVPSLQTFKDGWTAFSNNMFGNDFDWRNVFVAGGAVLKNTLVVPDNLQSTWKDSDIDLFLYDLPEKEATKKLEYIYSYFKSKSTEIDVIRTRYAVTFVSSQLARSIQVVLRVYRSPAEVLMGFDIDCCSIGYDGDNVYALPRTRRAIVSGINCVSMTRRSLTYEHRLFKYARRGFGILVPNVSRQQINLNVYSTPLANTTGLARLMLLEHKYINSFHGQVQIEEKSDYDNVVFPSRANFSVRNLINIVNYKDKSQFFSKKKNEFKHRHIAVTGYETALQGKASWCKKCRAGEASTGEGGEYVHGPITWVTQNPGRQLLTGSFHPVNDNEWSRAATESSTVDPQVLFKFSAATNKSITSPSAKPLPEKKSKTYNSMIAETDYILHSACAYGSLDTVQSIIAAYRSQINVPCERGFYPIHYASIRGSVDLVKLLISHGAIPLLRSKNYEKVSCLIIAQYYKNDSVFRYLHQNYPLVAKLKCRVPNRKSLNKWRFSIDPPISHPQSTNIFRTVLNADINALPNFIDDPKCATVDAIGNTLYHYAALSSSPKLMFDTLDLYVANGRLGSTYKNQTNMFNQSARHVALVAMTSLKPLTFHCTTFITPRNVMTELAQIVQATTTSLDNNAEPFKTCVPMHFLNLQYHHGASLARPSVSNPAGTGGFGVGGKFSPPQPGTSFAKPVGLFQPTKSPQPTPAQPAFGSPLQPQPISFATPAQQFSFGSPSQPQPISFATPTQPFSFATPAQQYSFAAPSQPISFATPTQPFSFATPINQYTLVDLAPKPTKGISALTEYLEMAKREVSVLQVPSIKSPNYPDFLRPGNNKFDESSQVAKALLLLNALTSNFTPNEMTKLRTMTLKCQMPIFNCIEAFNIDKDVLGLVDSLNVCLQLEEGEY